MSGNSFATFEGFAKTLLSIDENFMYFYPLFVIVCSPYEIQQLHGWMSNQSLT
ncbi:MAG: hypothetical protein Q6370_025475 [Candidatus Sigynarchaeota archaeon]